MPLSFLFFFPPSPLCSCGNDPCEHREQKPHSALSSACINSLEKQILPFKLWICSQKLKKRTEAKRCCLQPLAPAGLPPAAGCSWCHLHKAAASCRQVKIPAFPGKQQGENQPSFTSLYPSSLFPTGEWSCWEESAPLTRGDALGGSREVRRGGEIIQQLLFAFTSTSCHGLVICGSAVVFLPGIWDLVAVKSFKTHVLALSVQHQPGIWMLKLRPSWFNFPCFPSFSVLGCRGMFPSSFS